MTDLFRKTAERAHRYLDGLRDRYVAPPPVELARLAELDQAMPEGRVKKGIGLSSMKERAELSGGSFLIESEEGSGTTVKILWSLGEGRLGIPPQEYED